MGFVAPVNTVYASNGMNNNENIEEPNKQLGN